MPDVLEFLCYAAAFLCFFVSAVSRGRFDRRVTLVPLGLALWVLVPLVDAAVALD